MESNQIICAKCEYFYALTPHEDSIGLPPEIDRGLCALKDDRRPAVFGDMSCENAKHDYVEY